MNLKTISILVVLFVGAVSGCISSPSIYKPTVLAGQYVSGEYNYIKLFDDGTFTAQEHLNYANKTFQVYGTYSLNGQILVLRYVQYGLEQSFNVSSDYMKLVEIDGTEYTYTRIW